MNETVARIVELLFQDVEMNDEVKAIRDEVMDNCQERFVDLQNRGMQEDEAIAEVVESLKGMEEVLAGYPRKGSAAQEQAPVDAAEVHGEMTFNAESLRRLSVNMTYEDVTVEPSPDAQVHVLAQATNARIRAELSGGVLSVTRIEQGKNSHGFKGKWDGKAFDGYAFAKEFSFDTLGEMLGKLMSGVRVTINGDERVRVQIPASRALESVDLHTTSGDVGIDGLAMDALKVESRSGDLRVEIPGAHALSKLDLHTTSGDIEAWLSADRATVQSLSGDIRFVGRAQALSVSSTSGDVKVEAVDGPCEQCKVQSVSGDVECTGYIRALKASSTSGDVEVNATSETATFSTVSGDVTMALQGSLKLVEGHTTSGSVTIQVPDSVKEADIAVHTVSGDLRQGIASVQGAPVRIVVNTVSGDVNIR